MARRVMDCRNMPSDIQCTLRISGEEDEVLDAAVDHARSKHGHTEPNLRDLLRSSLQDE